MTWSTPSYASGGSGARGVVDASVLPFQISSNSAALVMALAWIAAERVTHAR